MQLHIAIATKTLKWLSFNFLFGLAPIWVFCFFNEFFQLEEDIPKKILIEGTITFFWAALTGAVLIDYILSDVEFFKKFWLFFIYGFPVLIVVYEMFVLLRIKLNLTDSDFDELYRYQAWIMIISLIYCSGIKAILFAKEQNKFTV